MKSQYRCRVCGADEKSIASWAFFGFTWGKCSHCKSTQKLLSETEYLNIDPTYDPGMYIENVASLQHLREELLVDDKKVFLQRHAGPNLSGKRFLDIGCGLGGFLLASQELGMIVTGFEPSSLHFSKLENICPEKFEIFNDYFDPAKVSGTFDLIMLSHVIEHIYDPGKFISGICSKLNPGGILIVVTPNNESIEARISGKRWIMYKPVDHVSMIGPQAARKLLPIGCSIESLFSDEYRGEFAVHIGSALKTAISGSKPTGKLASGERPRKQISSSSIPSWLKTILQIFSLPFWFYGKLTNGLACMTVIYKKESKFP